MKENTMKIKIILNPQSRNGQKGYVKKIIKEKFAHFLIDIEHSVYPGYATHIAQQAAKDNFDTVVVGGGDGTVNEVLNGIVGTNVALGIIPTGTANDLASFYYIPSDVAEACDVILEQCVTHADVICVDGKYYITVGGIGLPCEIAHITNVITLKRTFGKFLKQLLGNKIYILVFLCTLLRKAKKGHLVNIQWDGCLLRIDPLALMIGNQPFLGRKFMVSPGALNNDGLFDICLIENRKSPMWNLLVLMKVLKGSHVHSPSVRQWRTRELKIQAETSLPFFGDGEVLGQASEYRIKIVPKGIKVIVPRGYVMQQKALRVPCKGHHVSG
jgi:diacylglycerol kinase (ATP)